MNHANICTQAHPDMFQLSLYWDADQMSQAVEEAVCVHFILLMENELKESCTVYSVTFCVKIGKSGNKRLALLKMSSEGHAIKKLRIFEWNKWFKEDVHDDASNRQSKTQKTDTNVEAVWTLVCTDWRLSVPLIAEKTDYEQGNSTSASNRRFENEKNVFKDSASNVETMSASHFIWSFV